jgi:hypothetical protein
MRGSWLRPAQSKARIYLKNNQYKRDGGVAQIAEHQHSKHETLSSKPNTAKIIDK